MKKTTPLVYAKSQNLDPILTNEKPVNEQKVPQKKERIVDRLDLQLLVAIVVFFVSAWAFLNSRICGFTESEPLNIQMSYIFVHYVLTLVLILCIYITAVKGSYVLREEDISDEDVIKSIKFFIEGWFPTLILCILILATSSFIPWYVGAIATLGLVYYEAYRLSISLLARWSIILAIVVFFPIFVSTMTVIVKDIKVDVDKEYYSVDDNIIVSVETKGYACTNTLVCLGDKELYPNTEYQHIKNSIIVPAYCVINNTLSVGTCSPASGLKHFFRYPFEKMLTAKFQLSPDEAQNASVYYKSKSIKVI